MRASQDGRVRGRRQSVRWYAVGIVAITLVPALVIAGSLAVWSARSERAKMEESAQNQTREVAAAIDREVLGVQNALIVLASSPVLQTEEIKAFYDQAAEVSRKIGLQIVLRDRTLNRQLVNTAFPWGSPLTEEMPSARSDSEAELSRAGKLLVSNVFFGPLIKAYVVAVIVPVFRDGELRYSLSVGLPLARFASILDSLDVRPNQLVTVIDRDGIIVARSEKHSEFAGTRVKTPLPLDIQNVGRSSNREGIPFHWFNSRSDATGWYVSVGVPDGVLDAPSTRSLVSFTTAASLLLAIAIALSYFWGGRLAQSMGALGIDRKPTREEFEVLFESAPNGVMVVGTDGTILLVNQQLEKQFGYARGELVGTPVENLVPERLRGPHQEFRSIYERHAAARPMGADRAISGKRKDGSEFPIEVALNPIATTTGYLVMATVLDISARKLSEKKLSAALTERDDLRRRFMQAQEGERLRLAQELHDETGQSITAAMLELKGIEAIAGHNEGMRLRMLRRQLEQIGKTLHRVAWQLRPASIDEVGLASALSNYISEWSMQYQIEGEFYCNDSNIDNLPDEIRTTIYRVVQESLTNVAKHAQRATAISVVVDRRDRRVRLTIDDNGCGFDVNVFDGQEAGRLGRFGLVGMRGKNLVARRND